MKKLKKPSGHQIMVVLEWIIIINAVVAFAADIVSPATVPGWIWALCTAMHGFVGLMRLDRIKGLEKVAESAMELCIVSEVVGKLVNEQKSIIREQAEEIIRLKGEEAEHEHSENQTV